MNRQPAPVRTRAEPDLDDLADQITIGVLIEAFARYGITPRAFRAALHAIIHSDAFRADPEHGVWCACVPSGCPANAPREGDDADAQAVRDR